jgi:acetoin utilization deacetylase AcuC-like enzyme
MERRDKVLTVFSDVQRMHRHPYVVKQSERQPSYEIPERIDCILEAIREAGLGPVVAPTDAGLEPVYAVHDAGMVEFLATAYARHQEDRESQSEAVFASFFPPPRQRRRPRCFEGQKGFYCVDMEVPIGEHTWEAALASAHCAWTGAQHLQAIYGGSDIVPLASVGISSTNERGGWTRSPGRTPQCVYALCRPPGHHAGPDFCGGYCYLNNAAIAAQALRQGGDRVAILDIDYHHGNGTQAIFYADPDVGYASLHIDPATAYPFFAGYADETGVGAGEGTNWNVPLPHGTDQASYIAALETLLERVCAFDPQWLVVSAGFDAYIHDPIGTFKVTTEGFHEIGCRIRPLGKPILVVQEGGYHVPDLGKNVVALLSALVEI